MSRLNNYAALARSRHERRAFVHFRSTCSCAVLLALLSIGVRAADGVPQQAPAQPPQAATQAVPPPAERDYVLQRGDDLEVLAFNNDELKQKAKIRPDGKISVLLLGDVVAAGLTATQLAEALTQGYAKHFRNPRLSINVTSFSNQTVFVGGEVQNPKLLPLTGRLTVASALFSAGGLKPTANIKDIILVRDSGKGTPVVSRLNLNDVIKEGKPDIELGPFDVVFVPKTRIAKLDQFIDQHLKQLLPFTVGFGFSYLLGQQPLIQ